jgi:hypothetical protein
VQQVCPSAVPARERPTCRTRRPSTGTRHGWATIGPAGSGVNEVQKLTVYGYPTTGTFTLSFNGRETGQISGHPTAGEIEDALTRLIGIGRNDVPVQDAATLRAA